MPEKKWSGKRGSNSRPRPWQGRALPLSYSRKSDGIVAKNTPYVKSLLATIVAQIDFKGLRAVFLDFKAINFLF